MKDAKGRFASGFHASPITEFKKGETNAIPQIYWNKKWLTEQYINKERPIRDIARQFNVTETTIGLWLNKFNLREQRRHKQTRICKKCSTDKPLSDYYRYKLVCKECLSKPTHYRQIHNWVNYAFEKSMICEFCNVERILPRHIHWANKSGEYKKDRSDWLRLCVPCHKNYDLAQRKGRICSS